MKKLLLILPLLIVVTGCGQEKLTCTMSDNGKEAKATVFFKNGKAVSAEITAKADTKEESDAFCKLAEMGKTDNLKVKCSGKTVTMKQKLTENDEDLYHKTKDEIKKNMVDEGYTCK